jgi:hypothetical protein
MQHEYYRYLNGGYRVPRRRTDKMSSDVPVGLDRTYARLGDEPFSFEAWTRAVRAGRTFLSGGPILRLDGHEVGDTVWLSGAGTVSVEASTESVLPMASLQLVLNGEVVAETVEAHPPAGSSSGPRSRFAASTSGPARTPGQDRRMLTLISGGLDRIRRGRRYPEDRITHHHLESDHDAFLERPFLEAMERVRARMER